MASLLVHKDQGSAIISRLCYPETRLITNFGVMPKLGWWYNESGMPFTLESKLDKSYKWGLNDDSYVIKTLSDWNGNTETSALHNMRESAFRVMFNVPAMHVVPLRRDRALIGSIITRMPAVPLYNNRKACEEFYGGFIGGKNYNPWDNIFAKLDNAAIFGDVEHRVVVADNIPVPYIEEDAL